MKRDAWTPGEATALVRLVRAGATSPEIAESLKRSFPSVVGMRRKMRAAQLRGARGPALARMILLGEQKLTLLPKLPEKIPPTGTVTRIQRRPTARKREIAMGASIKAQVVEELRKDFDSFRADFFERMMAEATKRADIVYDLKQSRRTFEVWRAMMAGFGARLQGLERRHDIPSPRPESSDVVWWQNMIDSTLRDVRLTESRSIPLSIPLKGPRRGKSFAHRQE